MKYQFGQYRFSLLKNVTSGQPELFDAFEFAIRMRSRLQGKGFPQSDMDNAQIQCVAESLVFDGAGIHIFIDPDTEKVIEHATRKLSLLELLTYRPKNTIGIIYREHNRPALYRFQDVGDAHPVSVVIDEEHGVFRQEGLEDIERNVTSLQDEGGLEAMRKNIMFVAGVFMMMECFPDTFVEGLPDFVKHPAWYKRQRNAKICVEHVSRTVCPHIRSGHFRLLSSPRYTNMRGKVIFVKPSMVHGRASHTEKEVLLRDKK